MKYSENAIKLNLLQQRGLTKIEDMSEVKKIRYRVSKYTVKRQEWVEKYQSGQKINEIAEEEGILESNVIYQLKKAGVQFHKEKWTNRSKYKVKRKEWVEKYQSGQKINKIAEEEGVPVNTIRYQLEKANVQFRNGDKCIRCNSYDLKRQKWAKKYQAGISIAEIAKEENYPEETVRYHLKKIGVQFKNTKQYRVIL